MEKKTYIQTKEQRLEIIEELIKTYGEYYDIYLQKINQYNEYSMYVGKMRVDSNFAFIKRLPRDYENINGVQRALQNSKVDNIEETVEKKAKDYSVPNTIVITLDEDEKKEFVEVEVLDTKKEIILYKINLILLKNMILNFDNNLNEDEMEFFCGILADGHHRVQGLLAASALDFEVPITAYINLPKLEIYKVFIGINKYQGKPSSVHTLAIEEQAGILIGEDEQASRIMNLLNTDMENMELKLGMPENDKNQPKWSILFDRIKTIDGKRPAKSRKTYVTGSTFHKLIKDNVLDAINPNLSIDRKAEILNDYFSAWSDAFPVAWADTKTHILVKSLGFQIMIKLFPTIYPLLFNDRIPTRDEMRKFLDKVLKGENRILDLGVVTLEINWESRSFGGYSNGKGINTLSKILKNHINRIAQSSK